MRLKITHRTEYRYDAPVQYLLQRLRLMPVSGSTQTVASWVIKIDGAREEARFTDHFGNDTRLVSAEGGQHTIIVEAAGEVTTRDTAGVSGVHHGFAPLWLFSQQTPLTTVGDGIRDLAASVGEGTDIDRLHKLMGAIRERVAYKPGTTSAVTPAEEALTLKAGVCQDHSHIFTAVARVMGFPARYISGYLMMDASVEQAASHAWAEAHVPSLGWVAFDPANGISPDERYVRVATGRDYRDASPVSGILLGQAEEKLAVTVTVEQ
ncbi:MULTISPECIES: transglutaminase family protein [unclassified Mesorhizobium]|uniref:transglutaminase family protein n=1 Tax=unclassified Mesorhizobium TaxID=325217 RepID=UPI000FCB526C|nr:MULTISPECIES: transglutaminase family protein [unclassified Mesorhizobium]RUV95342.1 transglutaminase family protein [Mesorhizobium sp. M1A.F.Ca.IN.020.04.1.1]RUW10946.1 transglutaminase family protein [Mesorhizobium sp. M1A.F.Ca.IN.020.03.1.1]RWF72444.1 MAG: transglutaminase family protein [Mesorhizobium sp.]RWG13774.1 MAG: transglutaminase family protein [Mesorhizobium sp.]RWG29623.1 MAG: transglutaminase family protein [Mesorhizobium sp.]